MVGREIIMSDEFLCVDCQFDTFRNEYYMVKDEIWPIEQDGGMLCVGCLERRIGRELKKDDFIKCPVNTWDCFIKGERLKNRLKNE